MCWSLNRALRYTTVISGTSTYKHRIGFVRVRRSARPPTPFAFVLLSLLAATVNTRGVERTAEAAAQLQQQLPIFRPSPLPSPLLQFAFFPQRRHTLQITGRARADMAKFRGEF